MQHDLEQAPSTEAPSANASEPSHGPAARAANGDLLYPARRSGLAPAEDDAASILPPGFNLHETPEERDARISRALAVLESLRAVTDEEREEQRETWEYLRKALNEGRPSYAKLFPEDE